MVFRATWLRNGVLLLLGLASAACASCEPSGQAPAGAGNRSGQDSEARTDTAVPFELPPASSGWDEARDGITCRHPPVVADCKDGWCKIPKGCFVMGSPESEWGRGLYTENQTATVLTRPFVVQQTESTRRQWEALGLLPPGTSKEYGRDCTEPECPAGNLSWYHALAFANELSKRDGYEPCYELVGCTGALNDQSLICENAKVTASSLYDCRGYRLPTEAEWEYVARAGTRTALYSGEITPQASAASCGADSKLEPIAWYCHNGDRMTHPAGEKLANHWGLFDMLGNSIELTNDSTRANPGSAPWTDPVGQLQAPDSHVWKGAGAWSDNSALRAASRLAGAPNGRGPGIGFRLVRTLFE
jgi:formylglycine-generating enzyme